MTEVANSRAVGYLLKLPDGTIVVGAKTATYGGPAARISVDKDWLHIVTDDYEGHAMLNIEALPYLQKALRHLAKRLKAE